MALLDSATCLEPISEHGRTRTIHQCLPWHLHLAARAAEYVAQDLAKNISSRRLLWLARVAGPACPGIPISIGPTTTGLRRPS